MKKGLLVLSVAVAVIAALTVQHAIQSHTSDAMVDDALLVSGGQHGEDGARFDAAPSRMGERTVWRDRAACVYRSSDALRSGAGV